MKNEKENDKGVDEWDKFAFAQTLIIVKSPFFFLGFFIAIIVIAVLQNRLLHSLCLKKLIIFSKIKKKFNITLCVNKEKT